MMKVPKVDDRYFRDFCARASLHHFVSKLPQFQTRSESVNDEAFLSESNVFAKLFSQEEYLEKCEHLAKLFWCTSYPKIKIAQLACKLGSEIVRYDESSLLKLQRLDPEMQVEDIVKSARIWQIDFSQNSYILAKIHEVLFRAYKRGRYALSLKEVTRFIPDLPPDLRSEKKLLLWLNKQTGTAHVAQIKTKQTYLILPQLNPVLDELLSKLEDLAGPLDETQLSLWSTLDHQVDYLSHEQKIALTNFKQGQLTLLRGGPGTGKTTLVRHIVNYFQRQKPVNTHLVLLAPTGKAAERLTQQSGYKAQTIHRFWQVSQGRVLNWPWQIKGQLSLVEADESYIFIIDEASMLDLCLLSFVCRNLPRRVQVLLIGDVDQLPPLQAGDMLSELLLSGLFISTDLQTTFRQAKESLILENSRRLLRGKTLVFNQSLSSDFMQITARSDEELLQKFLSFYFTILPKFYTQQVLSDVQIYTPMNKGKLGALSLNRFLQDGYRKLEKTGAGVFWQGQFFQLGDKVMQVKNNYEQDSIYSLNEKENTGVYNGEMGLVVQIDSDEKSVTVLFDNKHLHYYRKEELQQLQLAYVTTVHKAQGSETEIALVVLPLEAQKMASRQLLYTALTRARKRVFLFHSSGCLEAYSKAFAKNKIYLLCELLQGYVVKNRKQMILPAACKDIDADECF